MVHTQKSVRAVRLILAELSAGHEELSCEEIAQRTGVAHASVRNLLRFLTHTKQVQCLGSYRSGDKYLYRANPIP